MHTVQPEEKWWKRISLWLAFSLLIGTVFQIEASAASVKNLISYINTESAQILTEPRMNAEEIMSLPRGEEVIVENWQERGFSTIRCGETFGYIRSSFLRYPVSVEEFSPAERGQTNADCVNVRVRPETESSIVSVVKKGRMIEVLGYIDSWYRVNADGAFGYIHQDYVDIDSPAEGQPVGYKKLRMGMTGMEVVRLQQALKDMGYYTGEVNGTYGARTRDAIKQYREDCGLSASGVADADTQRMIFES